MCYNSPIHFNDSYPSIVYDGIKSTRQQTVITIIRMSKQFHNKHGILSTKLHSLQDVYMNNKRQFEAVKRMRSKQQDRKENEEKNFFFFVWLAFKFHSLHIMWIMYHLYQLFLCEHFTTITSHFNYNSFQQLVLPSSRFNSFHPRSFVDVKL